MADQQDRPGIQPPGGILPRSPWVLIDDLTVDQTAHVLERITGWLHTAPAEHTASLAAAVSHDDTDPDGIANWVDCLAARLRRCAEGGEL